MNREELIAKIKSDLGNKILNWYDKSQKRIYIDINPQDVVEVARYFHKDLMLRFNTASGVHTPKGFEILYHFTSDRCGIIFSLRIKLEKPQVDSITPLFKGAEWIEREMHELLGINFIGHPNLRHLLLAEDWPEGKYPLRRDYVGEK